MIKFFRKIRKRMIRDNKVSKYLLYAIGEIILVVIGILIALQVNNWNETRQSRSEETKLLKEMKAALASDLEDILANIDEHESALKSCEVISAALTEGLPYHDSLDFYFGDALNTTRFGHTSSPYETLKAKGPDLIENDSLRLLLSEYFDRWIGYQFDLQQGSLESFERAKERQFELFQGFDFIEGMKPVDYELLKENQYYKSWLDFTQISRWWEAKQFHVLKRQNEYLQELIDEEINKD
jgi:hypothetical protein